MAALLTGDRVVFIDSRMGMKIETFRTREELLMALLHLADERTLVRVREEVPKALREVDVHNPNRRYPAED